MNKRYTNLDVIKLISAIIIVFHHYQQAFSVEFSGINFFHGSFHFSSLVELFFIISGFVTVIGDNPEDRHIGDSYLKKCIRIFPAIALSVTAILFTQLIHHVFHGRCVYWRGYSPLNIFASFLLIFQGYGLDIDLGVNNPTWYLCILLQCYIIFYIIKLLLDKKLQWKAAFYFIIAVLACLQKKFTLTNIYVPFTDELNLRGYSCFFIGALIAVFWNNLRNKRFGTLIGITVVLLWAALQATKCISLNNWLGLVFLYFGIVLLAVSVRQIPYRMIQKYEGLPFEVFLWHVPVFRLIEFITETLHVEMRHSYFSMIVVSFLVVCLAYLVYQYFETPVGKWLRKKLA